MDTKRICAGMLDYLIACVIQAILLVVFLIKPLSDSVESVNTINIWARQLIITYCSMMFLVIRDIIGKKSVGKRILKLKIIDKSTGNEANFKKRLVRNITWLLGPVDVIVYLFSNDRLGDKIAGTKVIENK